MAVAGDSNDGISKKKTTMMKTEAPSMQSTASMSSSGRSTGRSTSTSTSTSTTSSRGNEKQQPRASLVVHAPVVGDVSFGRSWDRRWQTMAMFSCSLYFVIPSVFGFWAFTLWCLLGHQSSLLGSEGPSLVTGLVALYLGYVFVLDKSQTAGTRPPLLRSFHKWWQHSCDYLPLLLVKTADLPTGQGQKYVLGYHPHGIISVGCFGAFATDGARALDLTTKTTKTTKKNSDSTTINSKDTKNAADDDDDQEEEELPIQRGFSSLFPGLDRRVITLPQNFQTPFLREYFLFMGACTSAKETFRTVLKRPHTALVVVVGGAAESFQSEVGSMNLVLETRKGFCREAILAQASLVPVLGFGETDLYTVGQASDRVAKVQSVMKRITGMAMPLFQGRSILFQDVGVMPQRKPVVVVVGAPLPPPSWSSDEKGFHPEIDRATGKALNDDGKLLNEYHAKYIEALEELYKNYKNAPWNIPGREQRKSMAIVK
jgi:2-acylglycerol O-acyltransferase 2